MILKWDLSEAFAAVILMPMITWLPSHFFRQNLDSRLRGNDENRTFAKGSMVINLSL